jgi:hypothetical protein
MPFCTGALPRDNLACAALPQFSDYQAKIPDVLSPMWSNTDTVAERLNEPSISKLYPIDGNDYLGNCVPAGAAHAITVHQGLIGNRVVPAAQDVINLYGQLGGRGMSGLNLTTLINAWQQGILGGNQIVAACNMDPSNMKAVKQAIQYFGGAYFAFDTTSQTDPQFQNKQPWTVTNARRQGGHCVYATGFNDVTGMYSVLTWGGLQLATYEWWDKYVTECHVVLSPTTSVFTSETLANLQSAMPSLSA